MRANASAQAELDSLRLKIEAQRAEAQQAVSTVRRDLERTETALEHRTVALLSAQVEVRELEKAQAEGQPSAYGPV